jgi:hypothetical protein
LKTVNFGGLGDLFENCHFEDREERGEEDNITMDIREWEVDGTDSWSCPLARFDINGIGPSGYGTRMLFWPRGCSVNISELYVKA